MLWMHSNVLYKKWGLKGIKFGFVQIGNQELIADFLGGIALEVTLIAGITNIHGAESSCFACSGSGLAGCQPFH